MKPSLDYCSLHYKKNKRTKKWWPSSNHYSFWPEMEVGYQLMQFNFTLKTLKGQKKKTPIGKWLEMYSSSLSLNIIVSHGNVGCLATSHKILVTSSQFLLQLATRKVQKFKMLTSNCNMYIYVLCKVAQFANFFNL